MDEDTAANALASTSLALGATVVTVLLRFSKAKLLPCSPYTYTEIAY